MVLGAHLSNTRHQGSLESRLLIGKNSGQMNPFGFTVQGPDYPELEEKESSGENRGGVPTPDKSNIVVIITHSVSPGNVQS